MVWQEFQPVRMGPAMPRAQGGCAPSASQPLHRPAPSQSDGKYVSAHSIKVGKSVVQILPSE